MFFRILSKDIRRKKTMNIIVLLSAALCLPMTSLCMDPIFGMLGISYGLEYDIRPLQVFLLLPLASMAETAAAAGLTSLYTLKIKASDTSDIE
ncbi:MAG: hypothetical protein IJ806_06735 [Ruminococcus sp.]|nr:hypothetical protein [Ruminococcus sp.]